MKISPRVCQGKKVGTNELPGPATRVSGEGAVIARCAACLSYTEHEMPSKVVTRWVILFSISSALAIVVGVTAFVLLTGDRATADLRDWPPLTMTYTVKIAVNDTTINQTRELTYTSRNEWIEEVIAADDIQTIVGTVNDTGSYQKVENGSYITYDASSRHTATETISEGVVVAPQGGFVAAPLEAYREHLGAAITPVATTTTVCFDDKCTANAPGWMFDTATGIVFADDERGIPIKVGNFEVIELRVQGAREPVRADEK